MFSSIKNFFKATWQKIKDWTGWSAAGTIFFSRLEGFLAFVGAVVAGLDWNAIMVLNWQEAFTNPAVWIAAGVVVLRSAAYEWTRRANAQDLPK